MSVLNTIKSILPHRLRALIRKLRVQYPYKEYMHRHRCKFVLHFLNEDTIWMHSILRPQYSYIHDYRGQMLVDYVGKYESIENDCKEVRSKLNIDVPLKKVNSSKRSSYQGYYTSKQLVDKVAMLYRKDIELFDYNSMAPLQGNA